MGVLIRGLQGLCAGLIAAGIWASIEGGAVIHLHGLRFESPLKEVIKLAISYAIPISGLTAILAMLRPKWSGQDILAAAGGIGFFALGTYWLGRGFGWFPTGWITWSVAGLGGFLCFTIDRNLKAKAFKYSFVGYSVLGLGLILSAPNQNISGASSDATTAEAGAADVVVLLIDTLRADHLSCYGYQEPGNSNPISPNLDRIASQGALFENSYAQAPWTRPSVASLMTGLYPTSHDTVTMFDRMPEELETIATLMQGRGYNTAAFSANAQVSPNFGFNRGFNSFWTDVSYSLRNYCALDRLRGDLIHSLVAIAPSIVERAKSNKQNKGEEKSRSSEARALNQQVFDWLDDNSQDQRPKFLYVQYIDPHDPYDAPDAWQPQQVPGIWQVMEGIDFGDNHNSPPVPVTGSAFPEPSQESLRKLLKHYDAEIRYCDHELNKLVERLEADGILGPEDYLVITADHGEEFYDHTQWKHGHSLFQEMVNVPLIIRGPQIVPQKIGAPVQLVDIFPTIAAWTGEPLNIPSHGRNLAPLMTTTPPSKILPIFFERPKGAYPMQAVRVGNKKLVRVLSEDSGEILAYMEFDLSQDPFEENNLAETREPDPQLVEILDQYVASSLKLKTAESQKTELKGDVAEALNDLGYMDGLEEE